jgi:acetyl-CoA C-acetyltransferase
MLADAGAAPAGRVIIGTVKGDLHDIGKNLVAMMCEGSGFEVIDIGFNADPEKFVEGVKKHQPQVVGMSAMLTTTMRAMGYTIKALEEAGLRDTVKIMVGGAPVDADFANRIGADGYGSNAPAGADLAKKFRSDPIYIKAATICQGGREGWLSQVYDLAHVEETYRGGLAAYREAGVSEPRKEISIAEVHDCFSITELTIMEDLQFSERGRVKDDIEAGAFEIGGELPVNTDGGLKCFGHPIGATGLRMLYEVYKQLQGKAGNRQVKNPRLGLTHNQGGEPGAATVSVLIAGNELG